MNERLKNLHEISGRLGQEKEARKDFIFIKGHPRKPILNILLRTAQQYWGSQGAGILFICKEDKTCLLGLRSSGVNEPGTWGIPGGAVEEGESPEDGAKREVSEELGSLPAGLETITKTIFEKDGFTYTTFVVNITKEEKSKWSKQIRLNWENERVQWFDLSTLPSNLHFGVKSLSGLLRQQSGMNLLPERKNRLDSYRNFLIEQKLSAPEKYHEKFDSLISEVEEEPSFSGREGLINFVKSIANKAENLASEIAADGEVKLSEVLTSRVESIRRNLYEEKVKKHLSKTNSNIPNALYHGTNFGDILSVLKSLTFQSASYRKISLTENFDLALNFGDTVLEFDAKKVIDKGARKMNYAPMDEVLRLKTEGRDEDSVDHPDGPIIEDTFSYEKEWSVKTPFRFKLSDLNRIYFVCDPSRKYGAGVNNYEEAMELVHSIVGDAVPFACSNVDIAAPFSPQASARVSTGLIGLKSFLYSNILNVYSDLVDFRNQYLKLCEKYGQNSFGRDNPILGYLGRLLEIFCYSESLKTELDKDYSGTSKSRAELYVINVINDILIQINGGRSGFSSYSKMSLFNKKHLDGVPLVYYPEDLKKEIEKFIDTLNEYLENLFSDMKEKSALFEKVSEEVLNLNEDASLYGLLFLDVKTPSFLKNKIMERGSTLFEKLYSDYKSGALKTFGDEYRIMGKIEELAKIVSPKDIPSELLKDNPIILIDHQNPDSFTDNQIREVLAEQPTYNADWILNHRYGYGLFDKTPEALAKGIRDGISAGYNLNSTIGENIRKLEDESSFYFRIFKVLGRSDILNKIVEIKHVLEDLLQEAESAKKQCSACGHKLWDTSMQDWKYSSDFCSKDCESYKRYSKGEIDYLEYNYLTGGMTEVEYKKRREDDDAAQKAQEDFLALAKKMKLKTLLKAASRVR